MSRQHLERLLNVRSAYQGAIGADGRLAFLTDITGTAQLWTLEAPMRWPEQRTFFSERLLSVIAHPSRPLFVFTMDAGGDEQAQVFLIDAEAGPPRQISPSTDAKHIMGDYATAASCFSPDGRHLVWSHNGRNGKDFDVYVYDLDAGQERRVFTGEGYNLALAWSADGAALIVSTVHSNIDNDLSWVEVETGARRHLTPHEGEVSYGYPCPSADGATLYLVTDAGSDTRRAARLDLGDGAITALEDAHAGDWDVEQMALSSDGQVLALVYNVDGSSEILFHDLDRGEQRALKPRALGVLNGLRAAPGGRSFCCALASPREPWDVWTFEADSGEMTRWTRSATAGIRRDALVEPELVRFESFDGLSVPGYFYAPPGDGPWPVVFDIHGGPEAQRRPCFMAVLQYLVSEGIAVYSPNVRGSRGYGKRYMDLDNVRKRMDSVADIEAARAWLVESGRAHPERVALYGGSYGGFMVLSAMTTYPDRWAAGVDIVGIANFVTFLENTSPYRRYMRECEYGSLEHDRDFLASISPIHHMDAIAAPLMVIHGANDPRVPLSEAEQVIEAVRARDLPVEALIYDDEGHGLAKRHNRLDAYPRVARFLRAHLLD